MNRMMIRSVESVGSLMKKWEYSYNSALNDQTSDMNQILSEMADQDWKPVMMTGSPEQGITILFE